MPTATGNYSNDLLVESRVQCLFSSDGNGNFFSAALLHGFEQERNIVPNNVASRSAKSAYAFTKTNPANKFSNGASGKISRAHFNSSAGDRLSFLSWSYNRLLIAGAITAFEEIAVMEILHPLIRDFSDAEEEELPAVERLAAIFDVLQGRFALILAMGKSCRVIQRVALKTMCRCESVGAGTYKIKDVFLPPPVTLESDAEIMSLCDAFWKGDSRVCCAKDVTPGSTVIQTIFFRRELFFALDEYVGAGHDDKRRLFFAIRNSPLSEVHSEGGFPILSSQVVASLRAASDARGLRFSTLLKKNAKPKGYLAAFNLYIQDVRKIVIKEKAMRRLSNNDLNKILGARWSALTLEEKAPYEEIASKDKARYMEEVKAYNESSTEVIAPRLKGGNNDVGTCYRSITAYAQFAHVEGVFVNRMAIGTSKMGKHLSVRWAHAPPQERELYESMCLLENRVASFKANLTERMGATNVTEEHVIAEDSVPSKRRRSQSPDRKVNEI